MLMRDELEEIKKIRVRNNDLWMSVLDIALKHAPDETKKLLAKIRLHDMMVSQYIGDIISLDELHEDR